jgi:Putative ABC exporter
MALAFRSRRTITNALLRALRDPRQLIALLVVVGYAAINIGVIIALLIFPAPPPLRALADALVPGGVVQQIDGVRGTLTLILLSLAASAAFENPLLQFAQADIDLVFATPIATRRLIIVRLLGNHLRAFAAAYFFWGLSIAPLLRLGGFEIWPIGALALVALTCMFATVDQLTATGLLWLAGRGADHWLMRIGFLIITALALLIASALLGRAVTGSWALLTSLLTVGANLLGGLFLPIGLAVDVITAPAHARADGSVDLSQIAALLAFDLITALMVIATGQDRIKELAVSPLGEGGLLWRALRRSRLNPIRFFRLAWSTEVDAHEERAEVARVRPFGRGAWVLTWVRLSQMRRGWVRTVLALGVLGLFPLAILSQNRSYGLAAMVSAIIFSASLATQVFNELRDHLTSSDTDLALPIPRWKLLLASVLAHLPLYWAGGLILIGGALLARGGADWQTSLGLALWYPLVVIPQLGVRGAIMFLFPAAMARGQRDPVQFLVVALVNGLVTVGLLLLALTPVGAILAISQLTEVSLWVVFGVLYICNGLLSALALLALVWAYGRYEPSEGH